MNILASYNWLKEYVITSLSAEEFARELSLRSMSVETIERWNDRFESMVVGVVKAAEKHPKADRLLVATVDCGDQEVSIVCGGTNLAAGMKVLVALPGSRVRWHGQSEWTTLEKTVIRGVESYGMICAPAEVGFDKIIIGDHDIWDLGEITDAVAGTPIVKVLDLDDVVFDVEITTNRPDAKGIVGLAREAGVAVDADFVWEPVSLPKGTSDLPLSVRIEDTERCHRQMAVVLKNVTIGTSPWWMQKRLLLSGIRPINAVVDITNYVMLEYAQPLHAFDYQAVEGSELVIRAGAKGEQIVALDGKTYDLNGHLVIADAKKPLDIAGIMGGEHTGISRETTTLVFVASSFAAAAIRRTARALNIASEAQLLFEKGLSVEMPPVALARAVALTLEICGGVVASEVFDERTKPYEPKVFPLRTDRVRDRIGVEIPDKKMIDILERLGFGVAKNGKEYTVTVPYWREDDIEGEIDFTEEVARMYGYHNMPAVLPASRLPEGSDDATLQWEAWTKRFLSHQGFTEFFSNSLVSTSDLECYAVSPKDAMAVFNPLSTDHTHLRPTLVPSVLRSVERNQALTASADIFELARVYMPREGNIPDERLALVVGSYGVEDAGTTFMRLRGVLELFAAKTGIAFLFDRLPEDSHWHAGRSATITLDGVPVGTLGQVANDFQVAFGIHRPVFLAMLDLESMLPAMRHTNRYVPVPAFPMVTRDIAILLDERTEYSKVQSIVCGSSSLVIDCGVIEIYRGEGIPSGKKSVTISVTMMAADRTLTTEEVDEVMATVAREIALRVDGVVRS
ncbi:MAG: phenylalanine--tRNA ligase subunit beta [Patescibacteria group bacterium]